MRLNKHGSQPVALLLIVLLAAHTFTLFAAEVPARSATVGSLNAVGSVTLRGVGVTGDGTVFSGDRLKVDRGGYAKVSLGAGPKIELAAGSDLTFLSDTKNLQVLLTSGNIAFKGGGKAPIHVRLGNIYAVSVPGDASGNVAYVGKDAFGVRVLSGYVVVRNTQMKEYFTVTKGSEHLVSLQTGNVTQPLAKVASTAPSAVPALPQARQSSSGGLSTAGWVAVVGTLAGAAAAVAVLTSRTDNSGGSAASHLAQVQALQDLTAISATATATTALATAVNTTANTALTAINNSNVANKAALQTAANAVIAKANSASSKILTLSAQVAQLENEIAMQTGGPTAEQKKELNQLIADLDSARKEANDALTDLNSLINQSNSSGVTGTPPPPSSKPVDPPVLASNSKPG